MSNRDEAGGPAIRSVPATGSKRAGRWISGSINRVKLSMGTKYEFAANRMLWGS